MAITSYKFDFVNYICNILEQCYIVDEDITPPNYNLAFYYNFKDLANIQADSFTFPAVYLDEPFKIEYIKKKSGAIFHRYSFTLIFMDRANMDETESISYEKALQFEDPIRQFISKLHKFSDDAGYTFNVIMSEVSPGYPFINMFDANVSGMIVNFVLDVEYDKPIC